LNEKSQEIPAMPTIMTDTLPADVSAYIQSELRAGKYQSADELVTAALRERRDREQQLAELRAKIDEGIQDFARGDYIEIAGEAAHEAFFDELKSEVLNRSDEAR
jgi:putative addiction module CopG family antidote